MAQAFPLLNLPHDALIALLSHLGHQDLLRVGATCTLLRQIASSDCLWASLCSPWEDTVNLHYWRAGVNSWAVLFRILKLFNDIVGYWTPAVFTPRGGLVYVTWGELSLIASRLLIIQAVELKLQRFFEVIALRNGSVKVKVITTYGSIMESIVDLPCRTQSEIFLESTDLRTALETSNGERELDLLRVHLTNSEHVTEESTGTKNNSGRYTEICSFHRVVVESPAFGKEFVGLWSGLYGGHGVEIINVTYTDEEIVGTKILGDPNVPSGQVTFKAKFSTESTQIPVELQRIVDIQVFSFHEQFTITKLFHGFGRIAEHNFINPEWIPGQLLVNQNNEIAFLWDDDNFVIHFCKLDVPSLGFL